MMKKNSAFEKNKVTNFLGTIFMVILISFIPIETLARRGGHGGSHSHFHSYGNSHSVIPFFFLMHGRSGYKQFNVQEHVFYEGEKITALIVVVCGKVQRTTLRINDHHL